MKRLTAIIAIVLALSACGVGEMGAAAAAGGASRAEEARRMSEHEARVQERLDAAAAEAARQRAAIEAATE